MDEPAPDSNATGELLDRAALGNPAAVRELFTRHRPAMQDPVRMYMNPRLAARVDPLDSVLEAHLALCHCLNDFLDPRRVPIHVGARNRFRCH
jgi:hypothetical protein